MLSGIEKFKIQFELVNAQFLLTQHDAVSPVDMTELLLPVFRNRVRVRESAAALSYRRAHEICSSITGSR